MPKPALSIQEFCKTYAKLNRFTQADMAGIQKASEDLARRGPSSRGLLETLRKMRTDRTPTR